MLFRHVLQGRYEGRVEFTLQAPGGEPFVIARRLFVVVSDAVERELLKPVAPYRRSKRAQWKDDGPVLPGKPPKNGDAVRWAREMLHFTIPPPLAALLNVRSPEEIMARLREEYFPDPLSLANHALFFQNLLWIEERRMK